MLIYLGLDVQVRRACPYYALNSGLEYVASGWLEGRGEQEQAASLLAVLASLEQGGRNQVAVGIDAPRMGLSSPRRFYWDGKKASWREWTVRDKGFGRHCEVVIKALKIANPQWTRLKTEAPAWMELGFALFRSLQDRYPAYEVFPSASYHLLEGEDHNPISLTFKDFKAGPKDMLDACIAALTVREYLAGQGFEVGGGDGLGTIILPRKLPIPDSNPLLTWPEEHPSQ